MSGVATSSQVTRESLKAQALQIALEKGWGENRIASALGVNETLSRRLLSELRGEGKLAHRPGGYNGPMDLAPESEVPDSLFPAVTPVDVGYGERDERDELISELRKENEELRHQMRWATRSEESVAGGTFTLVTSDFHLFDRGFLLKTLDSLVEKTKVLLKDYQPRRMNWIVNGDTVVGRGVYKNQDMDSVLPTADLQVGAGSLKFSEVAKALVPAIPTKVRFTLGQHDYSKGEPIAQYLVWGVRELLKEYAHLDIAYSGVEVLENCADEGEYNVLFEHGWGYSRTSPTSPAMLDAIFRRLLTHEREGFHVKRFCHAHTHWLNVGMEHVAGLPVDTTGGLQRNERVNLGRNERPPGWIVYYAPPGSEEILDPPFKVEPNKEILRQERLNPNLRADNMIEAGRCLKAFTKEAERLGFLDAQRIALLKEAAHAGS